MAITITYKSEQVTEQEAVAFTPSDTNELAGRERIAYGEYDTPASTGVVDGLSIAAARLPAGARVIGIDIFTEAMGTGAQVDMGIAGLDGSGFYDKDDTLADDDDLFAAAVAVATAGRKQGLAQLAGVQLVTDKEVYITATAENANWDAEKTIAFVVTYVVD